MKLKKISGLVLGLMIGVLAVTGCSSGSGSGDKGETPEKVNIGFFPNITHSQALVGKADGSFQKAIGEDVKLEWHQFNAGNEAIESLFAGNLDITYIGPGPAVNGFIKSDGDLEIVAGATHSGAVLVVGKESNIKSVKELAGKKVAVPNYGNTQDVTLRAALSDAGLKDTNSGGDVEIVQAKNPDIKVLLEREDIDAAFVPEPWGTRLEIEIGAKVLLDENQTFRNGEYSSAVVLARKDFVKENPELVEKILANHVELTDYIVGNQEEAKKTIVGELKSLTNSELPKEVLDGGFSRMTVSYDPLSDSVVDMAKISKENGFIEEELKPEGLFNLKILDKILESKGKATID
ncbi:taurine-binding periplasmic protein precursor [Andreesenia angusta]|uniref:Taurine-binding periplasmic protein n=1 Tax=Andreesenia angusta TaxID=39480 RepID=A0A1S1V749_9FIRM|nr:aliphatic sulfonate ABC transporter substrate-binding protein [Andreesenia angusta]OHW61529.1 taurine-binding periplasmic protein precursor [Andreesenia angusta]